MIVVRSVFCTYGMYYIFEPYDHILTYHKQGATKLLKLLSDYLLMVIFENGQNNSI